MLIDFVQNMFESAFMFFKHPENAYVIASFLIVVGTGVLLWALYLYLRRWIPLKSLNKILSAQADRSSFFRNYEEIRKNFLDSDKHFLGYSFWGHKLKHCWLELEESLVTENEQKIIWNTARPHNYIDSHYIQGPRVLNPIPNIFVGVGLVCTFLGLAASLQGISVNGDMSAMQESLQHVLSAASVKFIASITGLVLSIVLSTFIRFTAHSLDKQVDEINENLERGMKFVTTEAIAHQQLMQLQEQTSQLQSFNSNLAAELGREIEGRLAKLFKDGLSSVVTDSAGDSIEKAAKTLNEVNQSLLKVTDKINESGNMFSDQIQVMSNQLNSLLDSTAQGSQKSLEKFMSNLEGSIVGVTDRISTGVSGISDDLTNSISEAGKNFSDVLKESSNAMHGAVEGLGDQMKIFASSINQFDGNMKSHLQNIQTTTSRLQGLIDGFADKIDAIRNAGEPFKKSAEYLKDSGDALRKSSELLDGLKGEMGGYVEKLNESGQVTANSWEEYRERFEHVDKSLESIFENFAKAVNANQERVVDFTKNLDNSFTKASNSLAGAIEELQQTVEDLSEAQRK